MNQAIKEHKRGDLRPTMKFLEEAMEIVRTMI